MKNDHGIMASGGTRSAFVTPLPPSYVAKMEVPTSPPARSPRPKHTKQSNPSYGGRKCMKLFASFININLFFMSVPRFFFKTVFVVVLFVCLLACLFVLSLFFWVQAGDVGYFDEVFATQSWDVTVGSTEATSMLQVLWGLAASIPQWHSLAV